MAITFYETKSLTKAQDTMKPELIIFDNDGVLINSEILWHRQCVSYFQNKGIFISVDDSICFFCLQQENILSKVIKEEDIINIRKLTEDSYPQKLKEISGIHNILKKLRRNRYQLCVASNADKMYIYQTLSITQLIQFFQPSHLFSVDIVGKRKPAPDLFLYIADFFNLHPSKCLVIEDHPLGIRAAHLANMPVWAFLGGTHAKNKKYRSWVISESPDEIIQNVSALINAFDK